MMTSVKYAALAGVFVFTVGSAAWAQNYNPNSGMQGGSSPGQQDAGQYGPGASVSADTQQKIRQSLEQSGFKDVRVVPESFVVRAQAPDGSRVVMLLSPDVVSGVITPTSSQGMQGTGSQAYGGQPNGQNGNSSASRQQVEQELKRYGYTDLNDLRPMQGWTADATRNGQDVRVMLSDNGLVATFQGR
jgi:hypothetical protein